MWRFVSIAFRLPEVYPLPGFPFGSSPGHQMGLDTGLLLGLYSSA